MKTSKHSESRLAAGIPEGASVCWRFTRLVGPPGEDSNASSLWYANNLGAPPGDGYEYIFPVADGTRRFQVALDGLEGSQSNFHLQVEPAVTVPPTGPSCPRNAGRFSVFQPGPSISGDSSLRVTRASGNGENPLVATQFSGDFLDEASDSFGSVIRPWAQTRVD